MTSQALAIVLALIISLCFKLHFLSKKPLLIAEIIYFLEIVDILEHFRTVFQNQSPCLLGHFTTEPLTTGALDNLVRAQLGHFTTGPLTTGALDNSGHAQLGLYTIGAINNWGH